jgi:hypothetical protein
MLNLIRNNFPKGGLVRFLTDLATKIEKDINRICQKSAKDQKTGKPYLRSSNHPRKDYSNMHGPIFRFNKI